ncbi:MAG: hypothetical protein LBI72_13480 [Flavobacteriaceae bacterium]|nr:hypothetical protein [Flavobacteriaceae bacterium]
MKKRSLLTKLFILTTMFSLSQFSYGQNNQYDRYRGSYPWKVNLQYSMIDTNYSAKEPTSFNELNAASLPKLSLEYYAGHDVSFKLATVKNTVKVGQIVNGETVKDKFDVLSVDASVLYSIGGGLNIPVVDPYIETGLGYMNFNGDSKATYNLGGGVNIWLSDTGLFRTGQYNRDLLINRFGLNLSAMGKKNLSGGPGSYMELSAGVFFVF